MPESVAVYDANTNDLKVLLAINKPRDWEKYLVTNIEGLGPADANIAMSTFADHDGSIFHNARLNNRTIVISLGYSPHYPTNDTITELRKEAYAFFSPKRKIRLKFDNLYTIEGYVESIDPDIFTKDPTLTISILTESSHFSSVSSVSITKYTNQTIDLSSYGDAETGFAIKLGPTPNFNNFVIRNGVDPDIEFSKTFMTDDSIWLSTEPGNKYATLFRGSSTERIVDALVDSTMKMWITNDVTAFTIIVPNGIQIPYTLSFVPKWLGV